MTITTQRPCLQLIPELLLNRCRHNRFRPTVRQEQEIFEVDDLREDRQLLMQTFGKLGRSPIHRYKPKSPSINSLATLRHILERSRVIGRQIERPSEYPERHLGFEFPVVSFEDVRKRFETALEMFRLKSNHCGRIVYTSAEVHSH